MKFSLVYSVSVARQLFARMTFSAAAIKHSHLFLADVSQVHDQSEKKLLIDTYFMPAKAFGPEHINLLTLRKPFYKRTEVNNSKVNL